MSVNPGDTVRILPGARLDHGLSVGDEVTVRSLTADNFLAQLMGAPEGSIYVETPDGGEYGLESSEFELVAA